MTNPKLSDKQNPLDYILSEGENVLWQGKPNTTWLEYVREKPSQFSLEELKSMSPFNLDEPMTVPVKKPCSWFLMALISFVIGGILTFTIFFILLILFGEVFSELNRVLVELITAPIMIILFFIGGFFVGPRFHTLLLYLQKLFIGALELPIVKYTITDQRLIVNVGFWYHDSLSHNDVGRVIMEDSKQGASVTWLAVTRDRSPIQPFLGLSEFDVNHVLEIIRKRATLTIIIEDKRQLRT